MPKTAPHRVPPYKRPILIIGFLILLAVVVAVTVLVCKNLKVNNPDSKQPGSNDSNAIIDQPSKPDPAPEEPENKAPQYEGEDPNTLNELTGDITYIDIDPDTNVLHSAVMINQLLNESGQCVYNIKRDDVVIRTASAATSNDPSNSVCGPFSVSVEGLSGAYRVEVIVTGDNKQGIITQDIQI